MKILAFEFSSPHRSVAAVVADAQGKVVTAAEAVETSARNTMKPLALAGQSLKQAGLEREQIETVVVGLGPGSYTGIRAAIALAQGWQLARGVNLLGISSAECIAAEVQANGLAGKFSVVIDAQRGEFYLAGWENANGRLQEISPLRLAALAEIQSLEAAGEKIFGPEVTRWFPNSLTIFPDAAALARLAACRTDFVTGENLEPIYLREASFVKAPPPRALPPDINM